VHLHTHLSVDPLLRNFSVANVFPSCRMCSFAREVQFPSSTGTTPSLQQYEGGGIRIRVHAGASPVYHTQLQFRQQSAGWSGTLSTAQWSDAKEQLRSPSGGKSPFWIFLPLLYLSSVETLNPKSPVLSDLARNKFLYSEAALVF
jgi:hypothetical protein